jgi:hypothetical protein|tara:strand:- start:489 stop:779 length:291 start_codon:yes stop_codon:yes gene_type:complete
MARKPSLADLAAKKPAAAAASSSDSVQDEAPGSKKAGSQPDGRKGVLVRIQVAGWRQLRDLAAELTEQTGEQHSMQSLVTDAINRLLQENGRPPVA